MKHTSSQLANLRPQWGPNNPPPKSPGRPRKRPMSEANDDLLRRAAPPQVVLALCKLGLPKDATNADVLALCLFREGLAGNVYAIKELRESVEGKATQRIELVSHEDRQLDINVTFENLGLKHKPVEQVIDMEPSPAVEDAPGVSDAVECLVDSETQKEIASANGNGNSVAKGLAIGMALRDGEKD